MFSCLEESIHLSYDERPIIIFAEAENFEAIVSILEKRNWRKHKFGASPEVLREIRGWNDGIIILEKYEGIGVNTRFKKESMVLIACEVTNEAEYQQFLGRSSRTRGLCYGTYFPITDLSKGEVLQKIKGSNSTKLNYLGILLKFLSQKQSSQLLADAIGKSLEA